jgi:3-phytase
VKGDYAVLTVSMVVAACGEFTPMPQAGAQNLNKAVDDTAVVAEVFITPLDPMANIDGPAMYFGGRGERWLIATAKTTNQLIVYDAQTGALIRRVGGLGKLAGQLSRPNGIVVVDDSLLLVVERDNARVQAFMLPGFLSAGTFGETQLRHPYGITAFSEGPGMYTVYVTDNYESPAGGVPPDRELGERVKQYRLRIDGRVIKAEHVRSFGDTAGDGVIRVAESIVADRSQNRLLIAEELMVASHIKVYDLNGRFTGQLIGRGLFPQQAEGIALYACSDSTGYWIATDQGSLINTFHVFDRKSLAHIGSFTGAKTRLTDGIAISQRSFAPFDAGVLFASHLDSGASALSWSDIAAALRIRSDCTH